MKAAARKPPPARRIERPGLLPGLAALLLVAGCSASPPEGSLVLTQVPVGAHTTASQSILDQRYPTGSRVVLALPPFDPNRMRLLSRGLMAAGDPVVSSDAQLVYFSGKATANESWQIYQAGVNGGRPKQITSMEGGAMQPAMMAGDDLVFCSPVPKSGELWKTGQAAALYSQRPGTKPERLTFGTSATVNPTVLADGRILFTSALPPSPECASALALGLFTINNDGTELTHFALDHDGAPMALRPRELSDGRVAFLAAADDRNQGYRPEAVRKARPFASRAPLWAFATARCGSVEPNSDGSMLACLTLPSGANDSRLKSMEVYRVQAGAKTADKPLFNDPAWDELEAIALTRRADPMGHVSAIMAGRRSGTILCLNAGFTQTTITNQPPSAKPQRVRVVAADATGQSVPLGEVPLQPDGSFMAQVPADTALGFETLDATGHILQRVHPALWVRPGENRTCIGCHEPHNRSPRNIRPLAITMPPVVLKGNPLVASH